MRRVYKPKVWSALERSRLKKSSIAVGKNGWRAWEDHVLFFYTRNEAWRVLRFRTMQQIDYRREVLGIPREDPFFERKLAEARYYEQVNRAGRTQHELRLAA